ncbi:uncharacterized protein NECHADRAFT_99932 [Fusarium vanettenii 77-13-4]|uniref:Uncharacterized protein n=1 Tax=Fusarium vanettenii (strain ATCC MYA-4622 / CBS 123669 / FGSC 9596 / NRRL 45880 / 77-13-4) TaxID=660122 RepID=C7YPG3_FUSV7|nr:uncharacterized protein NECHADRAFT_99932 [Fusarium vanettenii 77-13-4]EEU46294.1 hypothetical protein NECHADRAFT_99932 [Fusarium vanettenii 77-13-4]
MNIADSPLFKAYARPILDSRLDPRPRRQRARFSPFGIMDTVMQYLLDRASLEVTKIKISNASESSFCLAIESRLVDSGAISSIIGAMDVELSFNGFSFGTVELPEVQTSFWGTKVLVKEQRIDITDMTAFRTFIRSLMLDSDSSFQLDNGWCTVGALGTSSGCEMCLDIPLKCMNGPQMELKKLSRSSDNGIVATFRLDNLSPMEIDHGRCIFELRNTRGETMAELRGDLNIVRGQADYTLHGTTRPGVAPSDMARLVGVGVEGSSWCSETIKEIDVIFGLKPEFAELLQH